MKPHRQTRSSKRVGSESGCANGHETPSKAFYGSKLTSIMQILDTVPPAERLTLVTDVARKLREGAT